MLIIISTHVFICYLHREGTYCENEVHFYNEIRIDFCKRDGFYTVVVNNLDLYLLHNISICEIYKGWSALLFFPQKMTLSDSQNSVQTYTSAPCYVLMASSSPRMDATCANANLVITIIDDCWYYMYCVSLSCTLIVFSLPKRVQQIWINKTDTTDQKIKYRVSTCI